MTRATTIRMYMPEWMLTFRPSRSGSPASGPCAPAYSPPPWSSVRRPRAALARSPTARRHGRAPVPPASIRHGRQRPCAARLQPVATVERPSPASILAPSGLRASPAPTRLSAWAIPRSCRFAAYGLRHAAHGLRQQPLSSARPAIEHSTVEPGARQSPCQAARDRTMAVTVSPCAFRLHHAPTAYADSGSSAIAIQWQECGLSSTTWRTGPPMLIDMGSSTH
jgi:hypothetical protein